MPPIEGTCPNPHVTVVLLFIFTEIFVLNVINFICDSEISQFDCINEVNVTFNCLISFYISIL